MIMRKMVIAVWSLVLLAFATQRLNADELDNQLAIVARVSAGAAGSEEAKRACSQLARHDITILPRVLEAMDTENIVAANWLRTVYEQIIDRELSKDSRTQPVAFLKEYAGDSRRQGRVRRQALATLDRVEPAFRDQFIAAQLDDPEFRSDAVAAALKRAGEAQKRGESAGAKDGYYAAFRHARDSTQITTAADGLAALGEKVSVVEHMGFVTDWYLLGPFAAPGMTGFDASFPPEKEVDLQSEFDGKDGNRIRWLRHHTADRLASIDLVQAIAPVAEAVAYAYTELNATESKDVQIRCSADDNLSVWLNGEKVFGRAQWLNGTRLDRFTVPARLKQGTNRLLVKICQGPQHKDPTVGNAWTMQLRVCMPDGAAAGFSSALPPIAQEKAAR